MLVALWAAEWWWAKHQHANMLTVTIVTGFEVFTMFIILFYHVSLLKGMLLVSQVFSLEPNYQTKLWTMMLFDGKLKLLQI